MKPTPSFALIAACGFLPLALLAQNTPQSGSTDRAASSSGDHSTYSSQSSGMESSGLQRVTKDMLRGKMMAKHLIGKEVYDNEGGKVGSITDIVLPEKGAWSGMSDRSRSRMGDSTYSGSGSSSATGSYDSTRSENANQGSSSDRGTSRSNSGTTGNTYPNNTASSNASNSTASTTGTTRTGTESDADRMRRNNSGTRDSSGADYGSTAMGAMRGAMGHSGISVIVSSGGFMGKGGDLLQIPLSQLNFDESIDRLTLSVSGSEWKQLKDRDYNRTAD